jgi:hypothetical protein
MDEKRKDIQKTLATGLGIFSIGLVYASAGWEGYLGHTTEMGQDLVVASIMAMNTFFLAQTDEVESSIVSGTVLTDLVQLTNIVKNSYYPSDDLRTVPSTIARMFALPISVASQSFFLSNL